MHFLPFLFYLYYFYLYNVIFNNIIIKKGRIHCRLTTQYDLYQQKGEIASFAAQKNSQVEVVFTMGQEQIEDIMFSTNSLWGVFKIRCTDEL